MNVFVIINAATIIALSFLTTTFAVGFAVTELLQGIPRSSFKSSFSRLNVYCYSGKPKSLLYIWQSVFLEINLDSENYNYYEGSTPEAVNDKYIQHHSSWAFNLFSWKQKSIKLDPFNSTCIGIETKESYELLLHIIRVDYWKILCLILGVTLFFSADKLSKNVLFYYICGVSFGMCASFLIVIYFFSKLFPKRPMMYGVAICGWTIGVYVLELLRENIRTIIVVYYNYVIWYAVVTGLISFIICYRWGPVTNERTRNLIRWSLQALGLVAIFHSTNFQEAAVIQIFLVISLYKFPNSWFLKSKTYLKRKFPPKVKCISNEEYYQQGVRETSKGLKELMNYCSSPECNQWKTVLKLQDVKRFASFMEGNSHLSDQEILEYESSIQATDLTDDEEDEFTD
ncbi:hypothetical protein RN001_004322 [Aquatica leii]|uniref:Nuclear envelope integral membrane protein 1 n=1 Tax=Aquatica leii TaxID=1421715 RepID=A0AAN7PBH6_9COLE|nr:hypothetical protein RN001_004322 [Aquatica leii]